jgi:hypothetical protein
MKKGIFTFWLLTSLSCLRIRLLYSPLTPFDVLEVVSLSSLSSYALIPVLVTTRATINPDPADITLDYLYDETLSTWAHSLSDQRSYLKMWRLGQTHAYEEQVAAYLLALHFSRVMLVADAWGRHANMAERLFANYPALFRDFVIVPADANVTFAHSYVGRTINQGE